MKMPLQKRPSKPLGVVAFTGHMMDRPDRPSPRFVPEDEERVTLAIRKKLETLNARIGFASAACGGDIIFLEEMLARGGEIHIVLPYAVAQFKKDCLTGFMENRGRKWLPRFKRVWKRARSRVILGDRRARDNSMASEYCNRTVLGLGHLRAQSLATRLTLVALWDGWSGDAPGGTRSTVKLASSLKVKIEYLLQLRPTEVSQVLDAAQPPPGTGSQPSHSSDDPPQQICAILFADVMRFSKLDETKLPDFISGYLQPLAGLIQRARHGGYGPLDYNTWGDGLFCIFDSMRHAGRFALQLQRLTISGKWRLTGSAEKLKLRVALHAGPVYRIPDPVFPKDTFMGTNVSLAARIEPKTPPGEIYCSQTFAALSAAEGVQDFACEYVGRKKLPKVPGTHPLYVLKPRLGSEGESRTIRRAHLA